MILPGSRFLTAFVGALVVALPLLAGGPGRAAEPAEPIKTSLAPVDRELWRERYGQEALFRLRLGVDEVVRLAPAAALHRCPQCRPFLSHDGRHHVLACPGPPEKDAVTAGQQRWLMSSLSLAEHQAIAPCSTKGSEWAFLLKLRILKIGGGQSISTLQETVATTAASYGSYDQIRA